MTPDIEQLKKVRVLMPGRTYVILRTGDITSLVGYYENSIGAIAQGLGINMPAMREALNFVVKHWSTDYHKSKR